MPRMGLLNPKNAVESAGGGGLKEGHIRVDSACFTVSKPREREDGKPVQGNIITALAWNCTRLDEELEPLTGGDDDEPLKEQLTFSLGGKSLAQIHPAKGDGPDDTEPQDLGDEPGVEGNTVFLVNESFALNAKSGAAVLGACLKKAGFREDYLDRVWAPDYAGLVCHVKSMTPEAAEEFLGMKKGTLSGGDLKFTYKCVDKIIRTGYEKQPKAKTGLEAAKQFALNGKASATSAEDILVGIMATLSQNLEGQTVTRKALNTFIGQEMQKGKVDTKLLVPVLAIVKGANGDKWLQDHAAMYSMNVDLAGGTVVFGE